MIFCIAHGRYLFKNPSPRILCVTMKDINHVFDYQPFHYELSGLASDYVRLLKMALSLFEQNRASAVWRLLERAERCNSNVAIEFVLLRAKALERCHYFSEAFDVVERVYQLHVNRPEIQQYLLRLHAKLLPKHAEQAFTLARLTLHQKNDWQSIIIALQILKQLQLNPVGACHYDGTAITGWLLDSPILPALTVTLDDADFKLTPYLTTPFLHQQGFGSGRDGFSLTVSADRFKVIRIHLNGLDLVGSPLYLNAESPQNVPQTTTIAQHVNTRATASKSPIIDIIIPVYKGLKETKACFNALLSAKNIIAYRIIVIDDASPEPLLVDFLRELHAKNRIELIQLPVNVGFVGAVNQGLRASCHNDVILLNADTCVHGDWLDRLHAVAYQSERIGSVTPLSNNAELLSFPIPMQVAAMPEPAMLAKMDAILAQQHGINAIEIPSGVGFCWYIKRSCLNEVGLLDDVLIERGYGEDTDFCLRAAAKGWKNVCASNVFVAHAGNVSFGISKKHLVAKNLARLHERYPEHEAQYNDFLTTAPLTSIYNALQRAILPDYAAKATALVVLPAILPDAISHDIIRALDTRKRHSVYYLAIAQTTQANYRITLSSSNSNEPLSLTYTWPTDDSVLWHDLRAAGFKAIKIHALVGWPESILNGLCLLGIPYHIILHDYSAYCLQSTLLKAKAVCTISAVDDASCVACIREQGCKNTAYSHPKALRDFSVQLFQQAETITVASADAAQRHRAYFPNSHFKIDRRAIKQAAALSIKQPPAVINTDIVRFAVFFAATPEQGFFNVLALARLLARQRSPIELIVLGTSWDDQALFATGKAWLTGPVAKEDVADLLRLYGCSLALHLAPWPEIDGLAWQMAQLAGLPLAAPELGIYKELLDESLGDIRLPLNKTLEEWLQAMQCPAQLSAVA